MWKMILIALLFSLVADAQIAFKPGEWTELGCAWLTHTESGGGVLRVDRKCALKSNPPMHIKRIYVDGKKVWP